MAHPIRNDRNYDRLTAIDGHAKTEALDGRPPGDDRQLGAVKQLAVCLWL